jgi:phage gp29-like protein
MVRMAVDRLRLKASEIIAQECRGSILREFPAQWLPHTLAEILEAARRGDRSARKAAKLLQGGRFKK